jgi:hypothetical protein
MQVTTHVHNEGSTMKANRGRSKDTKEKEDLIKGYEKAKLHEVSAYIATVMRKTNIRILSNLLRIVSKIL